MLKDILVFLKFLFFHPIRMPEYITACRMLIIIVHFTRVIYYIFGQTSVLGDFFRGNVQ